MLVITGGDPAGVGPELLLYTLEKEIQNSKAKKIVYFATSSLSHTNKIKKICQAIQRPVFFNPNEELTQKLCDEEKDFFILFERNEGEESIEDFPKVSVKTAQLAFQALKKAVDFILKNSCTAMLTLPISKEWIIRSGVKNFKGHTDYLAERFSSNVLMLMHGKEFSVIPLTVHIPIKNVSKILKKRIQEQSLFPLLQKIHQWEPYFKKKWGLCGLNPHAGENGYIGIEEKYLKKFVKRVKKNSILLEGPLSADSIFMPFSRKNYRLIMACYHDQALIPFKALEGEEGVNCTIGLPFLRCSPDHGTAYDIAFTGTANPSSTHRAFCLAIEGL